MNGLASQRSRVVLVLVAALLATTMTATAAHAKTLKPVARHGKRVTFNLAVLKGKRGRITKVRLKVDGKKHKLAVKRVRRNVPNKLTVRARGRKVRLIVKLKARKGTKAVPVPAPVAAPAPAPVAPAPAPPAPVSPVTSAPGAVPGFTRTFADDFTQNVPLGSFPAAVKSTWRTYSDGTKDTSGRGEYTPSKVVSWHDGM